MPDTTCPIGIGLAFRVHITKILDVTEVSCPYKVVPWYYKERFLQIKQDIVVDVEKLYMLIGARISILRFRIRSYSVVQCVYNK